MAYKSISKVRAPKNQSDETTSIRNSSRYLLLSSNQSTSGPVLIGNSIPNICECALNFRERPSTLWAWADFKNMRT